MAAQPGKMKFPGLFDVADAVSVEGRRSYVRTSALRLSLAFAAAVCAAFSFRTQQGIDLFALATAACFIGAVFCELLLQYGKPGQAWYDGRALAESAKVLSWKYAVRAQPFHDEDTKADSRLVAALHDLLLDAPDTTITKPTTGAVITDSMRELRSQPLAVRRARYLEERIDDQQVWYANKGEHNVTRAKRWRLGLIGFELLGVGVALLKAFTKVSIDLPGIVAAAIGVGVAWLSIQQHESLARAYAFAASELTTVRFELDKDLTEEEWAAAVTDAEEAISREHTMWRASRSSPEFTRRLHRRSR